VKCVFQTDDGRVVSVGHWKASDFEVVE
jgi:hypothetical protein